MRWLECTWEELHQLDRQKTLALLPVGAVEAHGPHLPLGTDGILAEGMAEEAARRLEAEGWTCLVLPTLNLTPAPFAASFPGTLSLSPETTTSVVVEMGLGIVQVARLLALANAHFDPANLQALQAAAEELSRRGLPVAFPNLTRRRHAQRLGEEFQSGACHAGRYETSLVQARRPDLVREEIRPSLEANPRSLSEAIGAGMTSFQQAGGPRAYFGAPGEASAVEGQERFQELGAILWEAVRYELER